MNSNRIPPKNIKERILVVEDESVLRRLLPRVLGPERFDFTLAASVAEGRWSIENEHFNLLLTDLRLPDGNGVEIIRQFKKRWPTAPVVVITGVMTPDERLAQVADWGVIECLHKPFEMKLLQQVVNEALHSNP